MALNRSNSSDLEQLALKGLKVTRSWTVQYIKCSDCLAVALIHTLTF